MRGLHPNEVCDAIGGGPIPGLTAHPAGRREVQIDERHVEPWVDMLLCMSRHELIDTFPPMFRGDREVDNIAHRASYALHEPGSMQRDIEPERRGPCPRGFP